MKWHPKHHRENLENINFFKYINCLCEYQITEALKGHRQHDNYPQ